MQNAKLLGTSMLKVGKYPERDIWMEAAVLLRSLLHKLDIPPEIVGYVSVGSANSGVYEQNESAPAVMVLSRAQMHGVAHDVVKAFCATGTFAFNNCLRRVEAGYCDVAVAVGVEQMSNRQTRGQPMVAQGNETDRRTGLTPPIYFALLAEAYRQEYGYDRETFRSALDTVVLKNRSFAVNNPEAQYQKPLSLAEVRGAERVAGPLRLYDCCPTGDSVAIAVITSADYAARHGGAALDILASETTTAVFTAVSSAQDLASLSADVAVAGRAYASAAIGSEDIDVLELHDAFSVTEFLHLESLGIFPHGEAAARTLAGQTGAGGQVVVNTSGGLLSRGHPLGATGLAQIHELRLQLLNLAGPRQVAGATVGAAQIGGGIIGGTIPSSALTILSR